MLRVLYAVQLVHNFPHDYAWTLWRSAVFVWGSDRTHCCSNYTHVQRKKTLWNFICVISLSCINTGPFMPPWKFLLVVGNPHPLPSCGGLCPGSPDISCRTDEQEAVSSNLLMFSFVVQKLVCSVTFVDVNDFFKWKKKLHHNVFQVRMWGN